MNPNHLHILQHSLGCDQHGRPTPLGRTPNRDDEFGCYRNRYVTDATCPAGQQCQELVTLGYLYDHGPQSLAGGMNCYSVTQAGYDAMRAASPPPPKLTRSQRTYRAYRQVSDLFPDGFLSFLQSPHFKRMVESYHA